MVRWLASNGQRVAKPHSTADVHRQLLASQPSAVFHESARCITLERKAAPELPGRLAVVAAGTSDMPVAEEAALTATFYGASVDRIYDVGVAGLHRLLDRAGTVRGARVGV